MITKEICRVSLKIVSILHHNVELYFHTHTVILLSFFLFTTPHQIEVMIDPMPLLVLLGAIAALVALFVSAAKYDVYGSVFWYQTPKLWIVVSAVSYHFELLHCFVR